MALTRKTVAAIAAVVTLVGLGMWRYWPGEPAPWTDAEIEQLRRLWIGSLPPVPPDPTNAVADDPRAARLGQQLFFDPRLSGNGQVACVTCHQPALRFTDGLPKGRAIGVSMRNTRGLVGAAYSPWLYWDGRKDSLWSQALSPLEDAREHGGNRMQIVRLIAEDSEYSAAYVALFGPLPELSDRGRFPEAAAPGVNAELEAAWQSMSSADQQKVNTVFANIGKAIAAYERLLLPGPSRFDTYVEAVIEANEGAQRRTLSSEEIAGLAVFIRKARCTECHNGPLFTNNEFHNTGILSFPGEVPDRGRIDGIREVQQDPFNCLGPYSDDPVKECAELRFARTGQSLLGATRTPSLRNLSGTAPYMHKGQMAAVPEILDHYNRAPTAMIGHNETKPLGLSRPEIERLEAFLDSLAAPLATPSEWLAAPDLRRRDRVARD